MRPPMRRKDRELSVEATLALLESGEYGVISSVGVGGQPYGVPVSYVVYDGSINFHSAQEGHKLNNFDYSERVSFCVIGKTEVLPDKFSTRYESVIVFGRISERSGADKTKSLQALIAKYSPKHIETGDAYIEAAQAKTRVFSISMDQVTGKARK